ncbi:Tad domain-containing protein [Methylovirgula sp. 4M-Z18]|uniref:Tad domain-containing protein n=1 Tax=Methylovirgula sp. 4M-Z18 TaxID=2293567 RepID=UPI001314536F|nr:Tad domain-containing protein [Methylovirgula sp. 4M-Z18]
MGIWGKRSATDRSRKQRSGFRVRDLWKHLVASVRAFGEDTRGVILPYVTIMLVVIVGVSVLALDGARYVSLQTQLQKGTDALAIAGAAELNGFPDAITRATAAINNTNANWVSNSSVFGSGANANVTITSITFYSGLPAGSVTPIPSSYVTTDPTQAQYVQVTATPTAMTTILPASFFGGSKSLTTTAAAVAGLTETVCGAQPLFVCNPFETSGMTYSQATQALLDAETTLVGHQVPITTPPGSSYTPGNYGWLQPDTEGTSNETCGPGGQTTGQELAVAQPDTCTNARTVNLNPGVKTPTLLALNIRFDIYTNSWKKCSSDPNYAPDQNVRKGYTGSGCNESTNGSWPPGYTGKSPYSTQAAAALPEDNCILAGTCTSSAYGDGNWVCGDISYKTTATSITVSLGKSGGSNITLTFGSTTGIFQGMGVNSALFPANTYVSQQPTSTTVTLSNPNPSLLSVVIIPSGTTITFAGYWSTAHPNVGAPTGCQGSPYSSITRSAVYNYENTNSLISNTSSGGESGAPTCSSSTPDTTGLRRMLIVPIINCQSSPVSMNGAATGVPVATYGKFFMTQPYDGTTTYAEYLGRLTPGSAGQGSLVQSVQLYR